MLAWQRTGEHAALYDLLGIVAARRGDAKLARECFAWSIRLDPSRFSAHMNLGQLALELGALSDAEVSFATAAQLRPNDSRAAERLQRAKQH